MQYKDPKLSLAKQLDKTMVLPRLQIKSTKLQVKDKLSNSNSKLTTNNNRKDLGLRFATPKLVCNNGSTTEGDGWLLSYYPSHCIPDMLLSKDLLCDSCQPREEDASRACFSRFFPNSNKRTCEKYNITRIPRPNSLKNKTYLSFSTWPT